MNMNGDIRPPDSLQLKIALSLDRPYPITAATVLAVSS